MKNLIRLTDYSKDDIEKIFNIVDEMKEGKYTKALENKTIVMFFSCNKYKNEGNFRKRYSNARWTSYFISK